jgi:MoaA/NifB/PqqE/SkfB family radical SAM enzyme
MMEEYDFRKEITVTNICLTRRCNLSCSFCRFSRDYNNSPYPSVNSYQELSADEWISGIKKLNSFGVFHTIYGAEPFMYYDIENLVRRLNEENIRYTLITNGMLDKKITSIIKRYGLYGISLSLDIVKTDDRDRKLKSSSALNKLIKYRKMGVKDCVAVTVLDSKNISSGDIYEIIDKLSNEGVWVEITLIDSAYNRFYDIAEENKDLLLEADDETRTTFLKLKELKKKGFLIHNNIEWFDKMIDLCGYGSLLYKCQKPWTSLAVDVDQTIRLCYRIKGDKVTKYKIDDLVNRPFIVKQALEEDLYNFCEGCTWNCIVMTEFLCDRKEKELVFVHSIGD